MQSQLWTPPQPHHKFPLGESVQEVVTDSEAPAERHRGGGWSIGGAVVQLPELGRRCPMPTGFCL